MREESSVSLNFKPSTTLLLTRTKKITGTLTGKHGERARDDLSTVTRDLAASRVLDHEQYGSRIVLVDTPGFNDTEKSDEYILKLIGDWLKKTYVESISPNLCYRDDHICSDTKKEYSYPGLCMSTTSPIRGWPGHLTALCSCSRSSLVAKVQ